jgi:CMP-N-acetylneuraminic acid synthetase
MSKSRLPGLGADCRAGLGNARLCRADHEGVSMILGHVGARKGSKGVPRKNFRDLHGKPLIGWSLDQLLEHPMIDAVVVSTDDEEIYEHAVAKAKADKGSSRPRQIL